LNNKRSIDVRGSNACALSKKKRESLFYAIGNEEKTET